MTETEYLEYILAFEKESLRNIKSLRLIIQKYD